MGLDQYAYWVKEDEEPVEFKYWRKTSHIDNWMRQRFFAKGGESEDGFNGERLCLTENDISDFLQDIEDENLEWVPGFFFGGEYSAKEHKAEDKFFALQCLGHLRKGRKVYYQNSW